MCRILSGPESNTYDMAEYLIQEGIPFRTLRRVRPGPPPPLGPVFDAPISIRLLVSGYKFTSSDYTAYVEERRQLLTSHRGRAALLRGGLVWRLASEHLSLDAAIAGPSRAAVVDRVGFHIKDPYSDDELWDDELTEREINLICGHYICYTGMFTE